MKTFSRFTTNLHSRLFVEAGSLFNLENGFDGIAAFVPCGLTTFRCECNMFIKRDPLGIVMVADLNPRHVIYQSQDVKPMVYQAMHQLVSHGSTRIGMNGIRAHGDAESLNVDACAQWLNDYGEVYPEVTITLVDIRNSFKRFAILCVNHQAVLPKAIPPWHKML